MWERLRSPGTGSNTERWSSGAQCLQGSRLVALRPARLLPPKRLLTPRSDRRLSTTIRGLLPGSPAITRVGLALTGLVQLSGRTVIQGYPDCHRHLREVTIEDLESLALASFGRFKQVRVLLTEFLL